MLRWFFRLLKHCLLAKVGASFVSPFVGRLDDVGHNGMELIEQIKAIFENYRYETEIMLQVSDIHPM